MFRCLTLTHTPIPQYNTVVQHNEQDGLWSAACVAAAAFSSTFIEMGAGSRRLADQSFRDDYRSGSTHTAAWKAPLNLSKKLLPDLARSIRAGSIYKSLLFLKPFTGILTHENSN